MSSTPLQSLTPSQRDRPVPTWLRLLAASGAAVILTIALLAGSNVLNSGPTEADVLRAFETGQADGASETQNALEADFEARINAITQGDLRAAELEGRLAASVGLLEDLGRARNEGYVEGFAQALREQGVLRRTVSGTAEGGTASDDG
jgi:hypothetical protein